MLTGTHHSWELAAAAVLYLVIRVVMAMTPAKTQSRFAARR